MAAINLALEWTQIEGWDPIIYLWIEAVRVTVPERARLMPANPHRRRAMVQRAMVKLSVFA